jgi:hypothetical protein
MKDKILLFTSLIAISGAIIYRLAGLNFGLALLALFIAILLYLIIAIFAQKVKPASTPTPETDTNQKNSPPRSILSIATHLFFVGLIIVAFLTVFSARNAEALISPWEKIDQGFLLLFLSISLVLLFLAHIEQKINILYLSLYALLAYSINVLVYQLGFGYDFFIHQATMELITETGSVEPKPLYYLGQYALLLIPQLLFQLPLKLMHLWLLPLAAALLIPSEIIGALRNSRLAATSKTALTLLFITLSAVLFSYTTPQNLAYLLLLIVILRASQPYSLRENILLFAISLLALLTQPIAGLPALLFVCFRTLAEYWSRPGKKFFLASLLILAVIGLPLALSLVGPDSADNPDDTEASPTPASWQSLMPEIPDQESTWLNTVYLFADNANLILLGLILSGLFLAYKRKEKANDQALLYFGIALFGSYLLSSQLDTSFLISYERSAYAERMLLVSLIFFSPFIIKTLSFLAKKLEDKAPFLRLQALALLLFLLPTLLYLSYPRLDNYHNSHGYSVSHHDLEAVRWIDQDTDDDYIVLANQQTSVAALKEFGFHKYYPTEGSGPLFYYPIPTASPLYAAYLHMVNDKPSRQTMLEAMDLAGVDTAYFVLSKYWWAADRLAKEAAVEADKEHEIAQGQIRIYRYQR